MSRTFLNGITDPRSAALGKVYTSDASGVGAWATAASGGGTTGWVDVTTQSSPVLTTNTAAVNNANINTILAAAVNGSTIYIPHGVYLFSASWTMPANKAFTFQGQGSNRAGSPGTAFTEIQLTTNLAATFITLNNVWYTQFRDLTFTAGVTQTVGACVDVGNNVGTSFFNCAFQSPNTVAAPTTFWNDVLVGTGANSWNQAVVSQCNMSAFKGRGIYCDSAGASLVVSNSVIQGQWGPTSGTPLAAAALAGIEAQNCGALQINDCDILGAVNNLLMDPAVGKVCASVFCTNTYFDNSAGSCIKIAGAGATVRVRFDTCSFTTAGTNYTTAGTNLSAFEIAGTFAFTATAGQGINLINCNVLNTFGTTGTTNAFLVANAADFSIAYCNIAAYTNGLNVTPIATLNVTKFNFTNNTCGTAGGYNGVTTGVLINAGSAAFKTYTILDNDFNGCTTPISDGGTVSNGGGQKFIRDNTGNADGNRAMITPGATVGTTVETIVAQVWCPANTLKAGTLARAQFASIPALPVGVQMAMRVGTAGTIADAAVVTVVGGAPTSATRMYGSMCVSVASPGATALIDGDGQIKVVSSAFAANGATTQAGTFNTTVGNWISFTIKNITTTTSTMKSGLLEIISPS